jgi:hypothetical protein
MIRSRAVLTRSLGCWGAQTTSLAHMAKGGNYVFTLSADGGILGWHVASLSNLDTLIQDELSKRSDKFTQKRHLRCALMPLMWLTSNPCDHILQFKLKGLFEKHLL